MGPLMKPPSVKKLSVLLAGAVLLCHGVFGALHLVCDFPACAGAAEHAAEHEPATGTAGNSHEHPAGHGAGAEYFAVIAGLLSLLLTLLPKCAAGLRIWLGTRWPAVLRRVPAVLCPPPTPTPPILHVFRL
jgi:hypothetical protein